MADQKTDQGDLSDKPKKRDQLKISGTATKRVRPSRAAARTVVVEVKRSKITSKTKTIAKKTSVKKALTKKAITKKVITKKAITKKTASAKIDKTQASSLEEKSAETKAPTRAKRKILSKAPQPGGMVLRPLTQQEKKARASALTQAKKREQEERAQAEARAQAEQTQREQKIIEEQEAQKRVAVLREQREQPSEPKKYSKTESAQPVEEETEKKKRPASPKRQMENRRRQNKLTIINALDESERQQSLSALRRRRQKQRLNVKTHAEKKHIARDVIIPEAISVVDLAARMAARTNDVIKFLTAQDITVKANDHLDADTAELVAQEFGHRAKRITEADVEEAIDDTLDKPESLKPRPPIITVMGHVNHGKTSLLDVLRKASVAKGEAGGITQHIGAYQAQIADGNMATFIDTPGHAAFTAMRMRGAKTTDIVILVIAADEGVMPQTIESINHAKAANTPIIVALNKMDVSGANPNKVIEQLLQYEIVCEAQGGDVLAVPISIKTGLGIEQLGEAIALQADLLELQANPERFAQGVILEAKLDKGAGHVATILIQRGTLHQGDVFVAGKQWGKVRRMKAFDGANLKIAEPSCPVWVTGLSSPVEAGNPFDCVKSEDQAKEISEYRKRQVLNKQNVPPQARSVEQIFTASKQKPELNYIIKTDMQGSADAIVKSAQAMSSEEIEINVVHAAVGEVNLSDVMLAETIGAKILLFNNRASKEAQKTARLAKIEMRGFDVIYALIDEIKADMASLLGPKRLETILGQAEILQLFGVGKKNIAAGCLVGEGSVRKNAHARILRDNVVIHEGQVLSLRRFKDNVNVVEQGQECGLTFDSPPKLLAGDKIECFSVELIEREIK